MSIYSTQGIILSRSPAGEADAFFSIYTKDFGKIVARAQGIKKENAKLKGHLEPLHLSMIQFVLGKNGARLTGASLLNPWPVISADFDKTVEAVRMADAFDRNCFPNDRDESLWNVLFDSFLALERTTSSTDDLQDFHHLFAKKFFACLGYQDTKSAASYGII